MKCSVHPENEAVGVCVLCGVAVCHQCQKQVRGRILCSNCYAELKQSANPQQQASTPSRPSVHYSGCLTFLLSIVPGLGHLYLGQIQKGLVLLILAIVLPIFLPILIAYSIFDCLHTARRLNAGEHVPDWNVSGAIQSFFSDYGAQKPSVMTVWGVLLLLVSGLLLLANTPQISDLLVQIPSTIQTVGRNLLALAMVALGGFLIWRTVRER
ncbi:MAG: DUF2180 family protein [Armatimonadetes bacterium]|nr:DUF2180 family protein [Armatimonadota bacterium]MCX7969429.1 DUF2180 family protein [Armatimonadota bacterium]MDW8143675.1 hypothetical protein [Armatimonadota bacterium]